MKMEANLADSYSIRRSASVEMLKPLRKGQFYLGHRAIGWGSAARLDQNFYVIVLREPFSMMISLYNFKASSPPGKGAKPHREEVEHIQRMEKALKTVEKVPVDRMLETLIARKDFVIERMMKNGLFHAFLLPHHCWEAIKSGRGTESADDILLADRTRAVLVASMRNLLRTNIVVTTEKVDEDLKAQLNYHAPHLTGDRSKILRVTHINEGRAFAQQWHPEDGIRPLQKLNQTVRLLISEWPEVQISEWLYSLASRIAVTAKQAVPDPSTGKRTCHLPLTHEEKRILQDDSASGREATGRDIENGTLGRNLTVEPPPTVSSRAPTPNSCEVTRAPLSLQHQELKKKQQGKRTHNRGRQKNHAPHAPGAPPRGKLSSK